ncbi:transposase [Streptacidiphilus sp. PAMC 29251]
MLHELAKDRTDAPVRAVADLASLVWVGRGSDGDLPWCRAYAGRMRCPEVPGQRPNRISLKGNEVEMAPPSKYSPEFREEAVRIALGSSKTISESARELDLNPETLRSWVKKHEKGTQPAADSELTVSERARLKELERRLREVEMENVFLKKAAAYVCPERKVVAGVGR